MFDKQTLSIPCPHCGKQTAQTVAWLKSNNQFACGGCSSAVAVDTAQIIATLKEADKTIAKFGRDVSKLGRKL